MHEEAGIPEADGQGLLPSLSPKFEGARFEKHGIPVELLGDLASYRDLLKKVSKELYKRDVAPAGERIRCPKAFEAAFKLSLKGVAPGSAIALLQNDNDYANSNQEDVLIFKKYFDDAKRLIDDVIRAVNDGGRLPERFPIKFLTDFGKIGKNLKGSENINFGYGEARAANFTDKVRTTLVLWASNEIEKNIEIVGKVVGLSNDQESKIDLKLSSGQVITGPYHESDEDDFIKAFRHKEEYSIKIKGTGVFNKQGTLKRISDIIDAELLDAEDLKLLAAISRVEAMKALPVGWCGGKGTPLSEGFAEWAVDILKRLVEEHGMDVPYVFPTPEGDIQFEWKAEGSAVDARLNPVTLNAEIIGYSADSEVDEVISLVQKEGLAHLKGIIANLFKNHE